MAVKPADGRAVPDGSGSGGGGGGGCRLPGPATIRYPMDGRRTGGETSEQRPIASLPLGRAMTDR